MSFVLTSADALKVCTTIDDAFNMLRPDESVATVTSDRQLRGFDVELRQAVLGQRLGIPYTLSIISSYGELLVKTRTGECDLGWAAFYQTGPRERCDCPLPVAGSTDWVAHSCCVDFSTPYLAWEVAVMHKSGRISFLEALGSSLFNPFTANVSYPVSTEGPL